MNDGMTPIVLASQSPRRAALLRQLGLHFDVIHNEVDESLPDGMAPEEVVVHLSRAKAESVAAHLQRGLVIGADTVVVHQGEILGKPKNAADAMEMLGRLSGATHHVLTGFTLIQIDHGSVDDLEDTAVTFRTLSHWEIEDYVATGAPFDKAGAYGIQERAALFVSGIQGDYSNVVGFPLTRFVQAWRNLCGDEAVRAHLAGTP